MKTISVHYNIIDTDEDEILEVAVSDEVDFEDERVIEAFQDVIDKYEDDGLTIDSGGSEESADFDLPDGFTSEEAQEYGRVLAEKLLSELKAATE